MLKDINIIGFIITVRLNTPYRWKTYYCSGNVTYENPLTDFFHFPNPVILLYIYLTSPNLLLV